LPGNPAGYLVSEKTTTQGGGADTRKGTPYPAGNNAGDVASTPNLSNGTIKIGVLGNGGPLPSGIIYTSASFPTFSHPITNGAYNAAIDATLKGIYITTSGGQIAWGLLPGIPNFMANQGYYDNTLVAVPNPAGGQIVYVGGQESSASTHDNQVFRYVGTPQ